MEEHNNTGKKQFYFFDCGFPYIACRAQKIFFEKTKISSYSPTGASNLDLFYKKKDNRGLVVKNKFG